MADATDSKSVGGNIVWVQVPLSAPVVQNHPKTVVFCLFLSFWWGGHEMGIKLFS